MFLSIVLLISSVGAFQFNAQRRVSGGALMMAGFGKPKEGSGSSVLNNNAIPDGGTPCLCGSSKTYAECCLPNHLGASLTPPPTEVVRARFSALCSIQAAFILASTHPDSKDYVADDRISNESVGSKRSKRVIWEKEVKRFAEAWDFKDLEFVNDAAESQLPPEGQDAFVTVKLQRKAKNLLKWEFIDEKIRFRKHEGKWAFVSTDMKVTKQDAALVGNVEGKGLSSFSKN
jgi:uncharacterized protein YchJ